VLTAWCASGLSFWPFCGPLLGARGTRYGAEQTHGVGWLRLKACGVSAHAGQWAAQLRIKDRKQHLAYWTEVRMQHVMRFRHAWMARLNHQRLAKEQWCWRVPGCLPFQPTTRWFAFSSRIGGS
jgi:hypothetical protein